MGHRVENAAALGIGQLEMASRGYLLFAKPPELWVGDNKEEQHIDILSASRREKGAIVVAGRLMVDDQTVLVHGNGSQTLELEPASPEPAVTFIQSLPGVNASEIKAA